jgi:hypothetical protein
MSSMTPYKAAKIVNAALVTEGIEKVIPPQMMYTYANKGYVKSVTVDGKKRITKDGLDEWLVGYINKLTGKTIEETDTNIDENQLTLDLDES